MVIEAEHSLFCPQCRRQYEAERTVCPSDGARLLSVPLCYPRPGNVFDSRYVLLETIGKGGMATIYRGYDAQARCQCALKVLKVKFSSEERAVAQFFMEARLARMLNHPNIVRILDFGMTQVGYLYIAMDLLHGSTLSALIRNEGAMEPSRAVGIFAAACLRCHENQGGTHAFAAGIQDLQDGIRYRFAFRSGHLLQKPARSGKFLLNRLIDFFQIHLNNTFTCHRPNSLLVSL